MAAGAARLTAAAGPVVGRFGRHDIRPGMDVYGCSGDYLGSVRRVRLVPTGDEADGRDEVAAIDIGSRWRPRRLLTIGVERVQTVAMERVVLVDDVR